MYNFLGEDYTAYSVLRKPGLPHGYTLRDMADDLRCNDSRGVRRAGGRDRRLDRGLHRPAVRRGSSRPGAPAGHPFERLHLGRYGQGRADGCGAPGGPTPMAGSLGDTAWLHAVTFPLAGPQTWLASLLLSLAPPKDPSDLVITIEAEDQFNFRDRLAEIIAPTLVAAGERDPFYTRPCSARRPLASRMPGSSSIRAWAIRLREAVPTRRPCISEGGWSQLPALNQHIYEKHRDRPLADVLEGFRASCEQVMALVGSLSEEELFTPGRYAGGRGDRGHLSDCARRGAGEPAQTSAPSTSYTCKRLACSSRSSSEIPMSVEATMSQHSCKTVRSVRRQRPNRSHCWRGCGAGTRTGVPAGRRTSSRS